MKPMPYAHRSVNQAIAHLSWFWLVLACSAISARGNEEASRPVQAITITSRYNVQQRLPKNVRDFLRDNPQLCLKQWSGIALPGGMQASLAMGMAGNVGPDIFETDIRQAVEQGLAYPLTEWIGQDGVRADGTPKLRPDGKPDLNGQIDDDEAKWEGWKTIKPVYRQ
ncbi:MAG: hypothetical protein WCR06_10870, partial [bacterium]